MPKICYVKRRFSPTSKSLINISNQIISDYLEQGFDLTLRQLFYQLVSRDIIANKQAEYKKLGSVINDARLAGLIDWDRITDLTRELRSVSHWESPADIIEVCSKQYRIDKWSNQEFRPEVWVEKDALRNVVESACTPLDVPYFSCRGYVSQSEMWGASQRLARYSETDQKPVILHFGDHDPSGIDMSRDIIDRMKMFGVDVDVRRLALNMDQIETYNPPPNPAKITDSRSSGYIRKFGDESWELDALNPSQIASLITKEIMSLRDEELWDEKVDEENTDRRLLKNASKNWNEIVEDLNCS